MKCRLFFFIVSIVLSGQFSLAQLSKKESRIISEFAQNMNDDLKNDNLHSSLSAAIIVKKKVIWCGAFGFAAREKDMPADSSTIYRIGSVTKTFTATLLLQLVEEGKVRLDDPVEKYVPEVKSILGYGPGRIITLRQLASHTSGLIREPALSDRDKGATDEWESKLLSCLPYTLFDHDPGQGFLYSNIGFAILGLALERATGVPYKQMVEQRIFSPLHMEDSYFNLPAEKMGRLAEGIQNKADGSVNTEVPLSEIAGRGYRVPNGGIFSTPLDLAKFAIALMDGSTLLKPESLRLMQKVPLGGSKYGLGLEIKHFTDIDLVGHNGSVPGYTAEFDIEEKTGNAIVLLRNYNLGVTGLDKTAHYLLVKF